jgi:hypothetical protein
LIASSSILCLSGTFASLCFNPFFVFAHQI